MKVQKIFNKVIEHNLYDAASYMTDRSLMCNVLDQAMTRYGLITRAERDYAKACINDYMRELKGQPVDDSDYPVPIGSLATALRRAGLNYEPEDLTAIYKDWYMRPYPERPVINLHKPYEHRGTITGRFTSSVIVDDTF